MLIQSTKRLSTLFWKQWSLLLTKVTLLVWFIFCLGLFPLSPGEIPDQHRKREENQRRHAPFLFYFHIQMKSVLQALFAKIDLVIQLIFLFYLLLPQYYCSRFKFSHFFVLQLIMMAIGFSQIRMACGK